MFGPRWSGEEASGPQPVLLGLADSGSDISAFLITLALNPVAGMYLNAHHPPAFGGGDGAVGRGVQAPPTSWWPQQYGAGLQP